MNSSTQAILDHIGAIPPGRVMGYARVAEAAGIAHGARLVVRILHTQSDSQDLPWWRVVRSDGSIGLSEECGGALQRSMLEAEGVVFDASGKIDLERYGYNGYRS